MPKDFMAPRFYRRLSRLSRLAVAASIEAIEDSGLDISDQNRYRIGVVFRHRFRQYAPDRCIFCKPFGSRSAGQRNLYCFPIRYPMLRPVTWPCITVCRVPIAPFCQNHLSGECALAYGLSLLEQGQAGRCGGRRCGRTLKHLVSQS